MTHLEYNLSKDALIDKYRLDECAENQTHLMQKWLDLLSEAQEKVSLAKHKVESVESRLFIQAKLEENELFPKKKVTDSLLKAWVSIQPAYKRVVEAKIQAEKELSLITHAKIVLEHRKAMIQVESQLWICGFFSRPKTYKKGADVESNRQAQKELLKESLGRTQHTDSREEQ